MAAIYARLQVLLAQINHFAAWWNSFALKLLLMIKGK
jgi:hypothetical protein